MFDLLKPIMFLEEDDGSGGSAGAGSQLDLSESDEGNSEEENESGSSEESEGKKWAGSFDSPEAMEAGYVALQKRLGEQGQELGNYRQHQNLINDYQSRPEVYDRLLKSETPGVSESDSQDDELIGGYTNEQLQSMQYDDPIKVQRLITRHELDKRHTETSRDAAQIHNDTLIIERGRELLVKKAQEMNNKELEEKFKDPTYRISHFDFQPFPDVTNKIEAEWQFVQANLAKDGKGQFRNDAFVMADRMMNFTQYQEQLKIETAEQTALNIQQGTPGARVLTPGQSSRTEISPQFTEDMDQYEAADEAKKMTREEREEYLNQ